MNRRNLTDACRAVAGLFLLFVLAGCTRTVTWEEEVPLNTGETIWVERSMPWELLGGFGNPFNIEMRPTRVQTISFKYHGKTYTYVGRADVTWIAVSPFTNEPVLIAPASNFAWDSENRFICAIPHYVQLLPDASGSSWTWPEKVESWTYNMPANVMASIPVLKEDRKRRYTRNDRDQRDAVYRLQTPTAAKVDPLYKVSGCLHKFGS